MKHKDYPGWLKGGEPNFIAFRELRKLRGGVVFIVPVKKQLSKRSYSARLRTTLQGFNRSK